MNLGNVWKFCSTFQLSEASPELILQRKLIFQPSNRCAKPRRNFPIDPTTQRAPCQALNYLVNYKIISPLPQFSQANHCERQWHRHDRSWPKWEVLRPKRAFEAIQVGFRKSLIKEERNWYLRVMDKSMSCITTIASIHCTFSGFHVQHFIVEFFNLQFTLCSLQLWLLTQYFQHFYRQAGMVYLQKETECLRFVLGFARKTPLVMLALNSKSTWKWKSACIALLPLDLLARAGERRIPSRNRKVGGS